MPPAFPAANLPAARLLAATLEPTIGQVYFAPEAHSAYHALGFAGSPGAIGELHMPDGAAYFTSRGALMGQVAPTVIAAAFAVFNPAAVVPAVEYGWSLTDAPTIRAARLVGAVAQLQRCIAPVQEGHVERACELLARAVDPLQPEGRPLFAGAQYHFVSDADPWMRFFQLGDILREYRGDAHTAAWVSAGLTAQEINLASELFMGLPARTYSRSRAWSDAEFDTAAQRLVARGWFSADHTLTEAGHLGRDAIESATDAQLAPAIAALGDDLDELINILSPWGVLIRAAGGYPQSATEIRIPQ